jgi:hypothetical protein
VKRRERNILYEIRQMIFLSEMTSLSLGAPHQLRDFVAKMAGFENRVAEYKEAFEKEKALQAKQAMTAL